MSYYTSVSGEIAILPPIPWGLIQGSPFLPDVARKNGKAVKFRIDEQTVTTDEGVLIRRSASAILPVQEDPYGARDLVAEVDGIVTEFGSPDGREFAGRFDCSGEDDFDLWRLEIKDGRAVKVRPRIVWPDGTEEVLR